MSQTHEGFNESDNPSPDRLVARAQVRLLRLIAQRAVEYFDEERPKTDESKKAVSQPKRSRKAGRTGL